MGVILVKQFGDIRFECRQRFPHTLQYVKGKEKREKRERERERERERGKIKIFKKKNLFRAGLRP